MAISADKKKNLTAFMNGINKKFGANTIGFAKDKDLKIQYLQSPSHEFNAMLNGGIGVGRITEFYGENSSGKTSMAIEIIAHNQKIDPDFVAGWFETEGSIDEEILKSFGVDMERLVYWDQTDCGAEQGLDILRSLIASGQFNMIVVNSVAGLAPKKEIEDDIEKQNVALTARMMSKLMRVITGACYKTKTSAVFINQVRTNVGVMYGKLSL